MSSSWLSNLTRPIRRHLPWGPNPFYCGFGRPTRISMRYDAIRIENWPNDAQHLRLTYYWRGKPILHLPTLGQFVSSYTGLELIELRGKVTATLDD